MVPAWVEGISPLSMALVMAVGVDPRMENFVVYWSRSGWKGWPRVVNSVLLWLMVSCASVMALVTISMALAVRCVGTPMYKSSR